MADYELPTERQNELSKIAPFDLPSNVANLEEWFGENQRPLPWRASQDPYRIWISEVMLQQTTVKAVLPYYERFLNRFPSVKTLATSSLEDVYEMWAGLGYYSRARNLHRAAQELLTSGFPKSATELAKFPGFGPYTSRAVSSQAFEEPVGILDGNVFRVLSRVHGLAIPWWTTKARKTFQDLADAYAGAAKRPSQLNQSLMELGATVCTPERPACLLCPLQKKCVARNTDRVSELPLVRPRRETEVWVWQPDVRISRQQKVALIENNYAPFLKGHWILPGKVRRQKKAPTDYLARHCVTHHNIFIQPHVTRNSPTDKSMRWVSVEELPKIVPSSIVKKVLHACSLISVLFVLLNMFLFIGCASKQKSAVQAPPQAFRTVTEPIGENGAIVTLGTNQMPRFSKDGSKLFFVGRRSGSNFSQVYVMELSTRLVRRLTFQNGQISSLSISDKNRILFSSDTEQIREFSTALQRFTGNGQPQNYGQLFDYDLDTSNIRQVTDELGSQTDGIHWPDGSLIVIWQQERSPQRIFRFKNNRLTPLFPVAHQQMLLRQTQSNEIMWIQNQKSNESQWTLVKSIDLQKPVDVMNLPFAVLDWDYSPTLNLFAFLKQNSGELIFWSASQNCWQRPEDIKLTSASGLAFHPARPQLAIASSLKEGGMIFLWDIKTAACTPTP